MGRKNKKPSVFLLALVFILIVVAVYIILSKDSLFTEKDTSTSSSSSSSGKPLELKPSLFGNLPAGGNGVLNIYFLDIGQGDCMIIHLPDDKFMMIDSGDTSNANKNKITQFTDMLGIERFDYLLLTHADSDHCGNMEFVFENYEIDYVFRPNVLSTYKDSDQLGDLNVGATKTEGGDEKNSASYFKFLKGIKEEGCDWEIFNKNSDFSGEEYEYAFDFLTPTADAQNIKYKDANDYSPIFTLTYNGTVVLFMGDAEAQAEEEFIEAYRGNYPDCDLLKVGHHGSRTSSSDAMLNAVNPEYAVIQCGVGNKYGHPTIEVLNRLKQRGVGVYRNDTNGDIAVSITAETDYKFSSSYIFCAQTDMTNNFVAGEK